MTYEGILCVPNNEELRNHTLSEAHCSKFTTHPSASKMYQDLRKLFWWNGMKRDIVSFIARYLTWQKVKIEHQKPTGLLQPLDIPECTWDSILIYFVVGLLRTPSRYDAAWVIVDRLTKLTYILPRWISWSLYKLGQIYI